MKNKSAKSIEFVQTVHMCTLSSNKVWVWLNSINCRIIHLFIYFREENNKINLELQNAHII
jgi:hypothetical protein